MAIYHLRVKFMKRSAGQSSVAAAAYRSGTKLQDERTNITHDYTRKSDVEHCEIRLPGHMPDTLHEREALWNAVELGIKRKDGQPAFEVEGALPRELDREQCVRLVRAFADDMFVARGVPVDIAIHRHTASDGGEHPHVHFLIPTRRFLDDGQLGKVAGDMQDARPLIRRIAALEKEGKIDEALMLGKDTNLMQWRKAWGDYSNHFLEQAGEMARIDHRTLAAQGIDREPQPNIGFAFYHQARELRGWLAERVEKWKDITNRQFERVKEVIPQRQSEFIAQAREYFPTLFPELHQPALEPERGQEYER